MRRDRHRVPGSVPRHDTPCRRSIAASSPFFPTPVLSIRLALSYSRVCFSLSVHHLATRAVCDVLLGDSARQDVVPCAAAARGCWFCHRCFGRRVRTPCALVKVRGGFSMFIELGAPPTTPPPTTNHVNQKSARRWRTKDEHLMQLG